jgi:hypothetical protein
MIIFSPLTLARPRPVFRDRDPLLGRTPIGVRPNGRDGLFDARGRAGLETPASVRQPEWPALLFSEYTDVSGHHISLCVPADDHVCVQGREEGFFRSQWAHPSGRNGLVPDGIHVSSARNG